MIQPMFYDCMAILPTRYRVVPRSISKRDRRTIDLVKVFCGNSYIRVHEYLVPRVIQLWAGFAFERVLRPERGVHHFLLWYQSSIEWGL